MNRKGSLPEQEDMVLGYVPKENFTCIDRRINKHVMPILGPLSNSHQQITVSHVRTVKLRKLVEF